MPRAAASVSFWAKSSSPPGVELPQAEDVVLCRADHVLDVGQLHDPVDAD
jgi:hypothetical protein